MILTEYDEKKHIKNEKQESWEEGKIEGIEETLKLLIKLGKIRKEDDDEFRTLVGDKRRDAGII